MAYGVNGVPKNRFPGIKGLELLHVKYAGILGQVGDTTANTYYILAR